MKKCLFAIAMVLMLGMTPDAVAQKHRHTPRTAQVDSTNTKNAIEAFSDTTSVAEEDDPYAGNGDVTLTDEEAKSLAKDVVSEVFGGFDGKDIAGMIFVLLIILTIFLFAPIGIIIAIFYFVNKNRREKYRLAQMAMQNGQPIPEEILKQQPTTVSDDYQAGIRQMFLGVGLAIFLAFVAGRIGFGIGALVFFIGLGKWLVARQARNSTPQDRQQGDNNNNNNSNIQNYD